MGPGRGLDTDRWFVVATNVLGGCQGTTGPPRPVPTGGALGSRFPSITVRDQVEVEVASPTGSASTVASVLGGSMGGMRALEWAVAHPDRVASGCWCWRSARWPAATSSAPSTPSSSAIRADPDWRGGDYYDAASRPGGRARRRPPGRPATYRTADELDLRFGRRPQPGEDPLGRRALRGRSPTSTTTRDKLVRRFDAGTYVVLTEAMNTHDVGRGRGGWSAALAACPVPTVVAGIDSDRLYPLEQQAAIADAVPGCGGLEVVTSPYGHDGFLIETEAVGRLVRQTLSLAG